MWRKTHIETADGDDCICGGDYIACLQRLLAAEREKVREMCAEIPKIWGFKAIDSEVFKSEGIRTVVIGMCDFIEREIRQLDLTALDDKEGK